VTGRQNCAWPTISAQKNRQKQIRKHGFGSVEGNIGTSRFVFGG
jgi:hypothetical protein